MGNLKKMFLANDNKKFIFIEELKTIEYLPDKDEKNSFESKSLIKNEEKKVKKDILKKNLEKNEIIPNNEIKNENNENIIKIVHIEKKTKKNENKKKLNTKKKKKKKKKKK